MEHWNGRTDGAMAIRSVSSKLCTCYVSRKKGASVQRRMRLLAEGRGGRVRKQTGVAIGNVVAQRGM